MNKTRRIIATAIGLAFALFGLLLGFPWLIEFPQIALKGGWAVFFFALTITLIFMTFSTIAILIGFGVVLNYTERSVKRLCALCGWTTYFCLSGLLPKMCETVPRTQEYGDGMEVVLSFSVPILLGVFVYKILLRFLSPIPPIPLTEEAPEHSDPLGQGE